MNRREFLGASAAAVGGAVAVAGCASSGSGAPQRDNAFVEDGVVVPYGPIAFVPNDNPFMAPSVTGVAKNATDSELSYVAVSFSVLNADHIKIGQAMANTNNLAPGMKWRFSAFSLGDWMLSMAETVACDITAW